MQISLTEHVSEEPSAWLNKYSPNLVTPSELLYFVLLVIMIYTFHYEVCKMHHVRKLSKHTRIIETTTVTTVLTRHSAVSAMSSNMT